MIVTLLICTFIIVPLIITYNTARSAEIVRESEELYRTLAEKSFASVYVVQDGKFCFLNSNAVAYSGYTMEELLNKDTMGIVHAEDKEELKNNAAEMLRGTRTSPYVVQNNNKRGTDPVDHGNGNVNHLGGKAGNSRELYGHYRT